jgi:hypothetical protein
MLVTVHPRIVNIDRLGIAPSQKDAKNFPYVLTSARDTMDIETRKYQPGDGRKQIHWKVTAKRNELFSRKYISNPKSETFVIMDLQDAHEDELTAIITEDQIIESTLAIANYFKNNNTNMTIYYDQDGLHKATIRSKLDFDVFYHNCITIHFNAKLPVDQILSMCRLESEPNSFFIIITHHLTDTLYRSMLRLSQEGNDLAILLMKDKVGSDEESIMRDIKRAGISFELVTREDEIEEVLNS